MENLQKIIAGLLFFCILIIGLAALNQPEDKSKDTITPALDIRNPIITAPAAENPIIMADEKNSAISFDREWVKMNSDPKFPAQYRHCSVALWDGSILVMGGQGDITGINNEVWRSPDHGITWNKVTSHAAWSPRIGHSCVALPDDSIVLMGGNGQNDVWRSIDQGATWTQMTEHADWSPRYFPSSVVMPDGSLLLLGGNRDNQGGQWNDVWRSTDKGATWTQMTKHAGWSARDFRSAIALPDGSVVVMGGNVDNDVWRSADYGVTWTRMTGHAGWTPRYGLTAVALQGGSILLMGGRDTAMKNDTWLSSDKGASWNLLNASSGWEPREFATSVVTQDGSVVLIGGEGEKSMKNDVWVFLQSGEPVPTKKPTPAPTTIIPTPTVLLIPPTPSEVQDPRNPSLFIRMDPIQDFDTNSSGSIIGPATLNMTITTNYPEGSLFFFDIINEDSSRHLLSKTYVRPAVAGAEGLNRSSFTYDAGRLPIGHYRAEATRGITNTTVTARFNVTPPGLWVWVWTNPIGTVYEGDNLVITGTTNLEPGSNLTIDMHMKVHPCPYFERSEVNQSQRWLCYHNCNNSPGVATAAITPGSPGKNFWKVSFSTTEWCWGEEYYFTTPVDHWINVTGGSSFTVSGPEGH